MQFACISMVKQDIVPVDIKREIYNEVSKVAELNGISLRKFVNEMLDLDVQKKSFLQKIAPKMNFVELTEESILLRENNAKQVRYYQITIRNKKLWCDVDDKPDCSHIHYVLMLPEIVKLKDKLDQI